MKVGMIFESGRDGADGAVCRILANRIRPGVEVAEPAWLDSKKKLIQQCGNAALDLLTIERCDRVFVVWDLLPSWPEKTDKPCRYRDRQDVLKSLTAAGVPLDRVVLVCITETLEAWLLADGRALTQVLSTPSHAFPVPDIKKPDRQSNPKATLDAWFQKAPGQRRYKNNERVWAERIVKALPDLKRIRRSQSFARFEQKLAAP